MVMTVTFALHFHNDTKIVLPLALKKKIKTIACNGGFCNLLFMSQKELGFFFKVNNNTY